MVASENSEGKTCLNMKDGISPPLGYVACLKLIRIKNQRSNTSSNVSEVIDDFLEPSWIKA